MFIMYLQCILCIAYYAQDESARRSESLVFEAGIYPNMEIFVITLRSLPMRFISSFL